ncbi:MAG: hypothetical protein PUE75_01695 [Eubacteriales bacterium]|nr:hypothetical protein [Eubacteriales bacterium]
MNNGNKYIFKIIVNSRLFDAYEAVVNTLEIYGIVISKDYRERTVVGKWNPILHNELGAKINVWTGEFRLWEDSSTTVVRLILSGNGDKASAKIMAKFFHKKLKRFISVQKMYLDKNTYLNRKNINHNNLTKELFTALQSADGKPKRSFGQQLCDALDIADALLPEKKQAKKVYKFDDNDDVSYYPDEDHEGHDHEPDGYCIEADEYIQDMM